MKDGGVLMYRGMTGVDKQRSCEASMQHPTGITKRWGCTYPDKDVRHFDNSSFETHSSYNRRVPDIDTGAYVHSGMEDVLTSILLEKHLSSKEWVL
jgi:hypothetical protein